MTNKYKSHLDILCEDDINKEIAQGLIEMLDYPSQTRIKFLDVAGGWEKCLHRLKDYIDELIRYETKSLLIIMDFDECIDDRKACFAEILNGIQDEVRNRVFLVGSYYEPEKLKRDLGLMGHNDNVGRMLLEDCIDGNQFWHTIHLKHNLDELTKLKMHTMEFISWEVSS